MNRICNIFLIVVVVASFLSEGNCNKIHCYDCVDAKGSACDAPFDPQGVNVTLVECGVGQTKYKDYQCIQYDMRMSGRTANRGCTPIVPNYNHCAWLYQQEVASHGAIRIFSCEQCQTDSCNNVDFSP